MSPWMTTTDPLPYFVLKLSNDVALRFPVLSEDEYLLFLAARALASNVIG